MEIVKYRVYNGTEEEKESAKYVLYNSLFSIVKMMAPITPFICEEVYQKFFKVNEKEKSIHISSWPAIFSIKQDKGTENIWAKFVEVLENVRKAKSEAKKSMKAEINLSLEKKDYELLKNCLPDLQAVSCAKEIRPSDKFIVDFL